MIVKATILQLQHTCQVFVLNPFFHSTLNPEYFSIPDNFVLATGRRQTSDFGARHSRFKFWHAYYQLSEFNHFTKPLFTSVLFFFSVGQRRLYCLSNKATVKGEYNVYTIILIVNDICIFVPLFSGRLPIPTSVTCPLTCNLDTFMSAVFLDLSPLRYVCLSMPIFYQTYIAIMLLITLYLQIVTLPSKGLLLHENMGQCEWVCRIKDNLLIPRKLQTN